MASKRIQRKWIEKLEPVNVKIKEKTYTNNKIAEAVIKYCKDHDPWGCKRMSRKTDPCELPGCDGRSFEMNNETLHFHSTPSGYNPIGGSETVTIKSLRASKILYKKGARFKQETIDFLKKKNYLNRSNY